MNIKNSYNTNMNTHRIYTMPFATVYPLYITKVEKKGRNKDEVDQVIRWLTGYSQKNIAQHVAQQTTFTDFFAQAPALNPNRDKITGVICGVRIEDIEDDLMREIRYMDKLVDELARGKAMDTILRD